MLQFIFPVKAARRVERFLAPTFCSFLLLSFSLSISLVPFAYLVSFQWNQKALARCLRADRESNRPQREILQRWKLKHKGRKPAATGKKSCLCEEIPLQEHQFCVYVFWDSITCYPRLQFIFPVKAARRVERFL